MRKTAIILFGLCLFSLPVFAVEIEVSDEILEIQRMIKENGLRWTAGPTSMTDIPLEERRLRLGLEIPDEVAVRFAELDDSEPPVLLATQDYFNWDEFGCVSLVGDQRDCGSCWDFAATHAFESAYLITEGIMPNFSEQQVLVCNWGGSGCNGGWMEDGYEVFMTYGAVEESCMPYYANDNYPCTQELCDPVAILQNYVDVPNNVNSIKNSLMYGPLSTTFTVYDDFYGYRGGCYEHADNEPLNHAVIIIGWDDNMCDGEGAWIVKNSWGTNFGVDGFFYMKYGSSGFGQFTQRPVYGNTDLPEFSFTPDQVEVNLGAGEQTTINFDFTNSGNGQLHYRLATLQPDGQDEYGYCWNSSDNPDGPIYNWVDISEIGAEIEFPYDIDDGNSGWLSLGFDFAYYGNSYNRIKVCTNGWASFMDGWFVNADNLGMPDRVLPNDLLAAFWDDLNFEYSGQAFFYTNNSDSAVITWQNVADSRNEGRFTFQIVLVAPDKIIYQYDEMSPARLDECTIGMENRTATIGLEIGWNEPVVHDDLTLSLDLGDPNALDWLTISSESGTIEANSNQQIPVTLDATGLNDGVYSAVLQLLTNDYELLVNEIPITMNVGLVDAKEGSVLPQIFTLHQIYPNPFNAEATIAFSLAQSGQTSIEIYNLMGQKVAGIFDGIQTAGEHSFNWQAAEFASGVYLVKLTSGQQSQTVRATLLK